MTLWRTGLRPSIQHSIKLITGLGVLLLLPSCGFLSSDEGAGGRPDISDQPPAVEAVLAKADSLAPALEYTGTTQPQQQIALRAQTAGEVIAVRVDVGDQVQPGDLLAQIDGGLLSARVNEAQAELSARRSEVAENQVSISDAQAAAAQAQATRDQAKIDADRLRQLADQGAISQQAAEAAELALTNAQQAVTSAQAQIAARQQAIAAATGRVDAQRAVVAEAQEQLEWVELRSQLPNGTSQLPTTVLTRLVDPGDYVQPGATLLELGDLSVLTVTIQVSELDLGRLTIGQPTQIRLDAFPDLGPIAGRITRISPVADTASRLVPVEVTMANPNGRIGSGLLARVTFTPPGDQRVIVPTSALATGATDSTIFVITQDTDQPTVVARPVTVGEQRKGQVEILSGLEPNESFVVDSDRPLESGQPVRLSILSEATAQ
ncbi:MAG: efflux RND transporter periplasmic adaptor subunit [Cyanobacteria bacterium P01_A01_bin.15]